MDQANPPLSSIPAARAGFRVWHLCLLTVFVAIAIVNIQDQRRTEPALIALAIGGFVLYALLGWAAWRFARRFESRMKPVPLLVLYLAFMSALFLVATVVYLLIEQRYLGNL